MGRNCPFCFWFIPREKQITKEGKNDESKNVFAQLPGNETKKKIETFFLLNHICIVISYWHFSPSLFLFFIFLN